MTKFPFTLIPVNETLRAIISDIVTIFFFLCVCYNDNHQLSIYKNTSINF